MKKLIKTALCSTLLVSMFSIPVSANETSDEYKSLKSKIESKQKTLPKSKYSIANQVDSIAKLAASETIWEYEPNNYFTTANNLPLGVGVFGTFTRYDIDVYKIQITKPGDLFILGVYAGGDTYSLMDLGIALYDKYDNILAASSYYDYGTEAIIYENIPVGTYYIRALDMANFASGDPYIISADLFKQEEVFLMKPIVNPLDDNDKVITGYADPNVTINIIANNKTIATSNTNSKGEFYIPINPLKADTFVLVEAKGGNNNYNSTGVTVLDKTPPSVLTVNTVTTKSKSITGKTEAYVSVFAKVGSKVIGSTTSNSKGEYYINIKQQKKNTQITMLAKDKAENRKEITTKVK